MERDREKKQKPKYSTNKNRNKNRVKRGKDEKEFKKIVWNFLMILIYDTQLCLIKMYNIVISLIGRTYIIIIYQTFLFLPNNGAM